MVKAVFTMDLLFSFVPISFMIYILFSMFSIISYDLYVSEYNHFMRKLFTASEYFVVHESNFDSNGEISYVNWLKEEPNNNDLERISNQLGMNIFAGFLESEGSCVVRYVAFSEEKEIKPFYVCSKFFK